jgi:hypothetical protein
MRTRIHKSSLMITLGMVPIPEHLHSPKNKVVRDPIEDRESKYDKNDPVVPLQTKQCPTCGITFFRKKCRSNPQWQAQKFCAPKCSCTRFINANK